MSRERSFDKHQFGSNIVKELSTSLYSSPISAYREAVSNALDAMISNPQNNLEQRIEIKLDGISTRYDIIIEDWGTGIEDYESFIIISKGEKKVQGEISSNEKLNEKIIGQKGMGKLSFLNLSKDNTVEVKSNNGTLGMQIIMNMEGFSPLYMNSDLALSHKGLKVIIKNAKRSTPDSKTLIEYLSKRFALRIARGAKIFVNGIAVHKPEDFDSHQFKLFEMNNGVTVYGNLNPAERPKPMKVDIFVKQVYVNSKGFDYKVHGWVNCDSLTLQTSRDSLYEGNDTYVEFITKLNQYMDKYFEKKSETEQKKLRGEKQIIDHFLNILEIIKDYSDMEKPPLSGSKSDLNNMGSFSNTSGDSNSKCTVNKGIPDESNEANTIIAKPINSICGTIKPNKKRPKKESHTKITNGEGKYLSPSIPIGSGNMNTPKPKLILDEFGKERPVIFYNVPDRLCINTAWSCSEILEQANPNDNTLKARILPLLVRAAIDAYSQSSVLSKDEWLKMYDYTLEKAYCE